MEIVSQLGDGIRELKINYAKGYQVYFKKKDGKVIVLLIGGDKSTQQKDIQKAKEIWNKLKKWKHQNLILQTIGTATK